MFGTIMGALIVAHYLGDYFVQTDRQAQLKGQRGSRGHNSVGRWHCFWHAVTYTLTMMFVLLSVLRVSHVDVTGRVHLIVAVVLIVNGITHYVIDRRWTLDTFARAIGKGGWIDNDPEALPKLDQAAHLVLLGVSAYVLTALI